MSDLTAVCRREDALLVVVDVQERLAVTMDRRSEVIAATMRLVKTAQLVGVPVIVTRQYPEGLGQTERGLEEAIASVEESGHPVHRADKLAFDCFADPGFRELVESGGRRQIVLTGMETHICIAQTALDALRSGLEVQIVADACCSRSAAANDVALDRLRGAGAVVTSSESVMYELVGAAGTDEFRGLLRIVKS